MEQVISVVDPIKYKNDLNNRGLRIIYSLLKNKPMKSFISFLPIIGLFFIAACSTNAKSLDKAKAVTAKSDSGKAHYYIDVHNLQPGKVSLADVEGAHKKDLATEGKYDVNFIKFWVDEQQGKVYCLSKAKNPESIKLTHEEAHGLMPAEVYEVTEGQAAAMTGNKQLFIDVHQLGPGKVTAKDVAAAHAKDLAVEGKYGVNFIDYWVDEKQGVIFCLSEAPDSNAIKQAHKEAHGLVPAYVMQVKQGE